MRRLRSEAGFTIVELLVSALIMVTITGTIFALMDPAQGTFQAQPEVADMQQRLRVGGDLISHDLMMAGAGTYVGSTAGALYNFFAPVMPYRRGGDNDDPSKNIFYRPDTITILYIPPTPSQTGVIKVLGQANSQEIRVEPQLNCGDSKHDQLCGFEDGMRVVIFDVDGTWDLTTVTRVQDEPSKLQYHTSAGVKLSSAYDSGKAVITQVAAHTYYLKSVPATNTYQLMHFDGYQSDVPVVDNVVKLTFDYYGEPQPPQLIPGKNLDADSKPPWTTYGPKPPLLGIDLHDDDEYGAGENCLFKLSGGVQVPRLSVLATGLNEVKLTEAQLKDGPWCPGVASSARFDADLLRIRHVRVTLRVQAALAALRGPAGVLFSHGGYSTQANRYVPDQEITFDVAPRNMNLGR